MKRRKLIQHLETQGCRLVREGGRHSWWENPLLNKRSAVPRHTEISDMLARKICKDLGVDVPAESYGPGGAVISKSIDGGVPLLAYVKCHHS